MDYELINSIGALGAAIITGIFSFAGVVHTSRKQHSITMQAVETKIALIQRDIAELDRKQAIHNGVIDRMYSAEKAISVMEEKQKVADHRIDDLEAREAITHG